MSFGVQVTPVTLAPASGPSTDTGTLFLSGPAKPVPSTVLELTSLSDFISAVADRSVPEVVPSYDALDVFFREGGRHVYFGGFDTDYGDGLTTLSDPKLGPGQLAVVGADLAYDATLYTDMQAVCQATNRVAVRDVLPTDITTAALNTTGQNAPPDDELGATFGPWVTVPGPAGVIGSGPRQVPASVVIAALCNRVDAAGNPNRAAAGRDFPLQYVTDFVDISIADRPGLFEAGVNCFSDIYDVLQGYGFQTNVAQSEETPYWQFNVARARMYLTDRCQKRGANYMFKPIDGKGRTASRLQGDLESECLALYQADGLFGDTAQDAYSVNVAESISQIAQGELHATAEVVFSLHAKAVLIDLVTVPIGGSVS